MSNFSTDKSPSLEAMAQDAEASIHKQEVEVQNALSSNFIPPAKRLPLALGMLAGLIIALWLQWPSIREPFPSPDPASTSAIAEADLELIDGMIAAFKVSQGRLPTSLDEVSNLPESVRKPAADVSIGYQTANNSYALQWDSPHWHVELNGATGKMEAKKKTAN